MPEKITEDIGQLRQRIRELEQKLSGMETLERQYREIEKSYTQVLRTLDNTTREIYGIRANVNMPQLYLDGNLNIVGYSADFLLLTNRVIGYARNREHISILLRQEDIRRLRRHLKRIRDLRNLPYEVGEPWELRYSGPSMDEVIGKDWIVYLGEGKYREELDRWNIGMVEGEPRLHHSAHLGDSRDCCLMTPEEYGGASEDVRVSYKIRTPPGTDQIRDLTIFISATSGLEDIIPDMSGYTICVGSNYNSLGRIQKQGGDVASRPEMLETDTDYLVEVERTGGRIVRQLTNLTTGEKMAPLEFIDYRAIYDRENHLGFYTFSGECEFYDIKIYTRPSRFDIEQFRIPFHLEVSLQDSGLEGRIFDLKYASNVIMGKPRHLLLLQDITQRKQGEEALRESEAKYRQLFEEGRVARSITTPGGRFLDVNNEMCKMTGYTREELMSLDAHELYVDPADRDAYMSTLQDNTYVRDYELLFKRKDGAHIDCMITSSVHRDHEGNVIGIQGSVHDITEKKRIEARLKEAQRMELIGRLASGVAHEVRNPLNAILAISEALTQDIGEDPEYTPYLEHIRTQVDRLSTLMKDLLDLGKPLQKKAFSNVPIRDICVEAIELWQRSSFVGERELELEDRLGEEQPLVFCDSSKIKQVLLNLLENAAQHSPPESSIRMFLSTAGRNRVRIRISDEGAGIEPKSMEEVFKPFYTTRSRGSGLGLSIVKNIVEIHGGTIRLENNDPGPGLSAIVTLPVAEGDEEPVKARQE